MTRVPHREAAKASRLNESGFGSPPSGASAPQETVEEFTRKRRFEGHPNLQNGRDAMHPEQGRSSEPKNQGITRQPTMVLLWLDRHVLIRWWVPLVCAVGICTATANWRSGLRDWAERAQAQSAMDARLQQDARAEALLVAQYRAQFLDLVARGFLGGARRQVWIDTVLDAMSAAGISDVELALLPAQRVSTEPLANLNGVDAFANPMTLRFPLAHGAQFLDLLEIMRVRKNDNFSVDACRIERASPPGMSADLAENLRAECRFSWFNFTLASATERG